MVRHACNVSTSSQAIPNKTRDITRATNLYSVLRWNQHTISFPFASQILLGHAHATRSATARDDSFVLAVYPYVTTTLYRPNTQAPTPVDKAHREPPSANSVSSSASRRSNGLARDAYSATTVAPTVHGTRRTRSHQPTHVPPPSDPCRCAPEQLVRPHLRARLEQCRACVAASRLPRGAARAANGHHGRARHTREAMREAHTLERGYIRDAQPEKLSRR